jgi:SAM-dependent methyltransferase
MSGWVEFLDSAHPIYVNDRHRDVHYRGIARDIRDHVPSRTATVLDYGCGDALHADEVAAAAGRLILCEAGPQLRAAVGARFSGRANITTIAPDQVADLPERSLDLIVMHSVAQYLTHDQLDALLALFRRRLKPDGLLVVGDVIPPQVSAFADAIALLRFGAREGFFAAALFGLVRTVFSSYRRLRSRLGLTRYDAQAITARLAAAGFSAQRAPRNIGHSSARMTFLARPA